MVLFCSPLSTRLVPGPRVQGQQPPQEPAPASCAWCGACVLQCLCVFPQPESGWQLRLPELGRVLPRQLRQLR